MFQQTPLNITPNFAAPLVEVRLESAEEFNGALRNLFLEREGPAIEPKVKTPTLKHQVFESDFNLFSWPDEPVGQLKQLVIGNLIQVVKRLNNYTDEQISRLSVSSHSWFHITRTGGYASVHNHPMASWSAVYCVDPGDDLGADNPDNGVLRFLDARPSASMFLDPGNMHLQRPYNHGSINYSLNAGQLLFFPSHLMHEVAPYHGQRERITVAANFWFKSQ
jgi:uncharacterized protein (TIGR02466 family)